MINFELKIETAADRAAVEDQYKLARKLDMDGHELTAAEHYKLAAGENHPLANYYLGCLYERGIFGKERPLMVKAAYHYRQALFGAGYQEVSFAAVKKAASALARMMAAWDIKTSITGVKYNQLANKFGKEWAENNLPKGGK